MLIFLTWARRFEPVKVTEFEMSKKKHNLKVLILAAIGIKDRMNDFSANTYKKLAQQFLNICTYQSRHWLVAGTDNKVRHRLEAWLSNYRIHLEQTVDLDYCRINFTCMAPAFPSSVTRLKVIQRVNCDRRVV